MMNDASNQFDNLTFNGLPRFGQRTMTKQHDYTVVRTKPVWSRDFGAVVVQSTGVDCVDVFVPAPNIRASSRVNKT